MNGDSHSALCLHCAIPLSLLAGETTLCRRCANPPRLKPEAKLTPREMAQLLYPDTSGFW